MNQAGYYGFTHDTPIHDGDRVCPYCGGMKEACYRYLYLRQRWVYLLLPCHNCQSLEFHAKGAGKVEYSTTWVNLPEAEQRSRIEGEMRERLDRLDTPTLTLAELQAEQPLSPSEEDPADEI